MSDAGFHTVVLRTGELSFSGRTSQIPPDLGYYLAGLADGEGCFVIAPTRTGYTCAFVVHMRGDDRPLLERLQRETGLGGLYRGRTRKQPDGHPSARWAIQTTSDCATLVRIFDQYPLRSKKARDFAIWREAVRAQTRHDWPRVGDLYVTLKELRPYSGDDETVFGLPPDDQLELEVSDLTA